MIKPSPSEHYTDLVLWADFRNGDRVAFQNIYQTHLNDLFNYGCKITPSRNIVIDSIQDMFIDIWQNRSNLSDTENIKYYLFKALRRRLLRAVKKDKKYCTETNLGTFDNTAIVLPFEYKLIKGQENKERINHLKNAINKLTERQKEVVTLIFYEGFSYEEVSTLIGINLRSTYTLAWKALTSLRKDLV